MRRYATLCLATAALGLAVAAAPVAGVDFSEWDIDDDGAISHEEFRLGMGTLGVYERWDSDHDGMLTDEEFRARPPTTIEERDAGFLDAWGLGDEVIEQDEYEGRAYQAYDRNRDGGLDQEEWLLFQRHAREQGWVPEAAAD